MMTVSRCWGCGLKRQYLSPTLLILPSQGPRSRTARTRPPVRPTPQAPSFQRKENPMGYGHLLLFYCSKHSLLKCLTWLFRRWFNRKTQRGSQTILTGPASDLYMHTGDLPVVVDGLVLLIWILAKSILIPKYSYTGAKEPKVF